MRHLAVFPVVLALGCATPAVLPVVPLGEQTFVALRGETGKPDVVALDETTLFREAATLYQKADFKGALRRYELLIERFPESRLRPQALFNAGLCLEAVREYAEAAIRYEAALGVMKDAKDQRDARFRVASCREQTGDWAAAAAALEDVLEMEILSRDRIEALTRLGIAREALGDPVAAEARYGEALAVYRDAPEHDLLAGEAWVSRAQFQTGEVYRELFRQIAFRLPLDRMERDLQRKNALFIKAQKAYMDTVRLPNDHWAIAAGFALGATYEDYFEALEKAEVPADLSEEELAVYRSELWNASRPIVARAVELYEHNLKLSERFGVDSDWVRRSREGLARLKALLDNSPPSQEH